MILDAKTEALIDKEIEEGFIRRDEFNKELRAMEEKAGRKNPYGDSQSGLDRIVKSMVYDIGTIFASTMNWKEQPK